MRLELTLCKEIVGKYFSVSRNDINLKTRISNNVLVVSNELVELWENFFDEYNIKTQFQEWFYTDAILSKGYIKKVKISDISNENRENEIIISTCELSRDKIIIGDMDISLRTKRKDIRFINSRDFNNDKKQRIKLEDINNIYNRNRLQDFFSLYETAIIIDVTLNSNSNLLAEYISIFYKDSKSIIIRDNYLDNSDNLRNFKKYILPYLNKNDCEITLQFYWENGERKRYLESVFNNIDGYNVRINKLPNSGCLHESFIESDNYKFNLGYRMKIFGDRDDGLTEQDTISITRK